MKILIADDEPLARDRLRRLIADLDSQIICAEASNGLQVLEQITEFDPDIVLLDIRMPEMDGIAVSAYLSELPHPPAVIFTTAYDQYSMQAFQPNALAYLLKPIRANQLQQALDSAQKISKVQLQHLAAQQQNSEQPRNFISIRLSSGIRLIAISQIVCFLAEQKYVIVKYIDQQQPRESVINESLKTLEHELSEQFVRIHRNCLIKKDRMIRLRKSRTGHLFVKLKGLDQSLEVSRRHHAQIRRLFQHYAQHQP